MKVKGWKELLVALKNEYRRDQISNTAGAVTFFAVLALFPFLIFTVALAGVIIDPGRAQLLVDELRRVAPQAVVDILSNQIRALGAQRNVGLLTAGAAFAFYSASNGMVALSRALNAVHGVREHRSSWRVRARAALMTLVASVFGVLAALIVVLTPAAARLLGDPFEVFVGWLRLPVAGVLMMFLWALLYYALPDVQQRFRLITPGSVFGVLLWVLASWVFSFYVARFGRYDVVYGALGGVIVFLLWLWISVQALLIGAELNAILEQRSGDGAVANPS
ncbi:MAG: YihY/virulence factor BrkB family protein [Myxococcota bacterium]